MTELILEVAVVVGLVMLVWDCVEVGRNDAANLVNAVFGSRVMRRRAAVGVAGVAVVLGAVFASPVMETARQGIFDPIALGSLEHAAAAYLSVYIVDTVLLYTFSVFGMPVSTTALLIFELTGAALALSGFGSIHWGMLGRVVAAIFVSIFVSGMAGFLIQRAFRGAIGDNDQDPARVNLHGPWITGVMLTWLTWFMLVKGLAGLTPVRALRELTLGDDPSGAWLLTSLLILWGGYTFATWSFLAAAGERGSRYLFAGLAVLGMICMSFAFGQNDLANCAAPGLALYQLWVHKDEGLTYATQSALPIWALFGCGVLIYLGMRTRNAQRVTRAAANTGSQFEHVQLYAPVWCRALARVILRLMPKFGGPLAPTHNLTPQGKRVHFDRLRAAVIMSVSGSVIAFASSQGLPVSTTYVTFSAIVATGFADRVFTAGDADVKLGRAIWVVFGWLLAAVIAVVATGAVALAIVHWGLLGITAGIATNLAVRWIAKRRADAQDFRVHGARTLDLDEDHRDGPSMPSTGAPPDEQAPHV